MNSPDIQIELFISNDTYSVFLEDTTGLYSPTNLEGYGLPGGPDVNDVTSVTITLNYTQLDVDVVYAFTIVNGVITVCTLSFANASPVNITSELPSTAWPF